jgi:integral membrane sensor domain MASE1
MILTIWRHTPWTTVAAIVVIVCRHGVVISTHIQQVKEVAIPTATATAVFLHRHLCVQVGDLFLLPL